MASLYLKSRPINIPKSHDHQLLDYVLYNILTASPVLIYATFAKSIFGNMKECER